MPITQEEAHWALVELSHLGYAECHGEDRWSVTQAGTDRANAILLGLPVADGVLLLLEIDRRLDDVKA